MGFVLRRRGRGTLLLAAWLTTAAFSPLAGRVVRAQAVDGAANKASPHSNDYEELWVRLDEIIRYEVREKQLPAFSIAVVTDKRMLWSAGRQCILCIEGSEAFPCVSRRFVPARPCEPGRLLGECT